MRVRCSWVRVWVAKRKPEGDPCHALLIQPSATAKKTWRSAVYSFFKPEVTIEVHEGRVSHFFACSAKKCKTSAKGIRRYQDKGDKSSTATANLRHHAMRCFGEDTVNMAMKGEPSVDRSGNIFNTFAHQGKQPATYSHRAHSTPEFRYVLTFVFHTFFRTHSAHQCSHCKMGSGKQSSCKRCLRPRAYQSPHNRTPPPQSPISKHRSTRCQGGL